MSHTDEGWHDENGKWHSDDEPRKEQAMRFNEGKPQYSMLDLRSLQPAVRVLEFGAEKYERDNWKKGMPMSKILDSMLRHIAAIQTGEMIDPESGLPHVGHIQCNALFLGGPCVENDMSTMNWTEEAIAHVRTKLDEAEKELKSEKVVE